MPSWCDILDFIFQRNTFSLISEDRIKTLKARVNACNQISQHEKSAAIISSQKNSPNALAMATFSKMAMSGMMMRADPNSFSIPAKSKNFPSYQTLKSGTAKSGSPASMLPVRTKVELRGLSSSGKICSH